MKHEPSHSERSCLNKSLSLMLISGALSATVWMTRIAHETHQQITDTVAPPGRDYGGRASSSFDEMERMMASTVDSAPTLLKEHDTVKPLAPGTTMTEWLDKSDLKPFEESLDSVDRRLHVLERLVRENDLPKAHQLLSSFPTLHRPSGNTEPQPVHILQCQEHLLRLEKVLIAIRHQLSPEEKQEIWGNISLYLLSMNLLKVLEQNDPRIQTLRILLQ